MAKTQTRQDSHDQAVDQVVEIIRFMGENKLAEIDLETSKLKLRLKKHSDVQPVQVAAAPVFMPSVQSVEPMPARANTASDEPANQAAADTNKYHKILSPMAGTFYRAPSPTSEPFCAEGGQIEVGETICIVEAMKMMNEIKADRSGKINKILVENGNPVEKGAVLFYIGD